MPVEAMIWIGGVVAILLILHFLASWAEGRGWIFYRRSAPGSRGRGVALSIALSELEVVLNPALEHRVEEEQRERISRDELGIEMDNVTGVVRVRDSSGSISNEPTPTDS
ncbi:MAG TPA: hypothetical protein VLA91_12940 [Acidimicrobiia bacterium]|nr:hypothetical protein [Acidimicrobiia bacterium]